MEVTCSEGHVFNLPLFQVGFEEGVEAQYKQDIKDFISFIDYLDNGLRSSGSWRAETRKFKQSLRQLVEE